MSEPDEATALKNLLADSNLSRDELFASVASSKPKTKTKKRLGLKKGTKLISSFIKTDKNKSSSNFVLSGPTNFRQAQHIGFDAETGDFTNLPSEWEVLLGTSGMSKDDWKEDPETLLKVLKFQESVIKEELPAPGIIYHGSSDDKQENSDTDSGPDYDDDTDLPSPGSQSQTRLSLNKPNLPVPPKPQSASPRNDTGLDPDLMKRLSVKPLPLPPSPGRGSVDRDGLLSRSMSNLPPVKKTSSSFTSCTKTRR